MTDFFSEIYFFVYNILLYYFYSHTLIIPSIYTTAPVLYLFVTTINICQVYISVKINSVICLMCAHSTFITVIISVHKLQIK